MKSFCIMKIFLARDEHSSLLCLSINEKIDNGDNTSSYFINQMSMQQLKNDATTILIMTLPITTLLIMTILIILDTQGLYYKTFYGSNCCRIIIS